MTDLDKLERLARAATPGPWTEDDGNVFSKPLSDARHAAIMRRLAGSDEPHPDDDSKSVPDSWICGTQQQTENFDADCEFIAAANPDTVLRLIAELRKLRK